MGKQKKAIIGLAAGGWLLTTSYCAAAQEAEGDGTEVFMIGREEGFLLIGSIVLLIILFVITFIHMRKFNKSEKALLAGRSRLSGDYSQLEAEYNRLADEKSQLESQYQEVKKERDKAEKLAYTDYLTSLPNEANFVRILDSVIVTLRSGELIAVVMAEISNFQEICDRSGYKCGDELLIDAAHRIMQALDENDALAKGSGSRFLILTQNIENTSGFEDKLKKIQKVFSYPVVLSTSECFVNLNIGITLVPKDGKSSQTLLKNAETALYEAGRRGENQYVYFNESLMQEQLAKLQMQADLRSAIAGQEFGIYYQPVVDLRTHKIVGAEALIRWVHPKQGVLLPADFLPLAEQSGQIVELGRMVLATVCREWRDYIRENSAFKIAVNISARQLKDDEFVKMTEEVLEKEEFPAECLQFDIEEVMCKEEQETVSDIILSLKELGLGICFDNFGKGFSSLNQLLRMPFDSLKVTNILLDSVFENGFSADVIKNLVELAHNLKLTVIAEKVEFTEQEEVLIAAGFDYAQGYLYGHPLPFQEIEQFL